jgi:hypothetical protein
MFGDWAMIIVFGIWAKVLTGSNADAGLVFFVFALASLVAPLGALLVDRVHKQPLIAGAGGNRRVRAHRPVGALRCRRRGDWLLCVLGTWNPSIRNAPSLRELDDLPMRPSASPVEAR